MNLPSISNKMKNQDKKNTHSASQKLNDSTGGIDSFGLGIQVFKISSVKNIEQDKSNTRKFMKNIQNPVTNKPMIPMPKRLPSLDKSDKKDLSCSFIASKTGYNDRIIEKTGLSIQSKQTFTPNTYQIKKKMPDIPQKRQFSRAKPQINTGLSEKQKQLAIQKKMNQAMPQDSSQNQIMYHHYKQELNNLVKFYQNFTKLQKQRQKQIRKLKRYKQNEMTQEMKQKVNQLQNQQILIEKLVDLENVQEVSATLNVNSNNQKDKKKPASSILSKQKKINSNKNQPTLIHGFLYQSQHQSNGIQEYVLDSSDFGGKFQALDYENIDYCPISDEI